MAVTTTKGNLLIVDWLLPNDIFATEKSTV